MRLLNWILNLYWRPIMSKIDELLALVREGNDVLTEVASDVDALVARLPEDGGLSAAEVTQLKTELEGHVSRMREVASKYEAPIDPPVPDPGPEPTDLPPVENSENNT